MFSEIIITVADVDAAVGFYTEACRWRHVRTVEHDGATAAELDAGGQRVTLIPGEHSSIRLVMDTGNIRADHRRLTRLGVQTGGDPVSAGDGTWLPFTDPAGNPLGYFKPTETDT
jgi:predicted enzyme related to lactoylglutathione lyase